MYRSGKVQADDYDDGEYDDDLTDRTEAIFFAFSIMGGKDINIIDAPYHVGYGRYCCAVLIHYQWAITTAHCG